MPLEFQYTQFPLFICTSQKLENLPQLIPYSQFLYQFKKSLSSKSILRPGHCLVAAPKLRLHHFSLPPLWKLPVAPLSPLCPCCLWGSLTSMRTEIGRAGSLPYHPAPVSRLPTLLSPHVPPCCLKQYFINRPLHSPSCLKDSSLRYLVGPFVHVIQASVQTSLQIRSLPHSFHIDNSCPIYILLL